MEEADRCPNVSGTLSGCFRFGCPDVPEYAANEVNIPIEGKLGTIRFVGPNEEAQFLYTTDRYYNEKTKVKIQERVINVIDDSGVILKRVKLLDSQANFGPTKQFQISNDGSIYQMLFDDDLNLYIYKVNDSIEYSSSIAEEKMKNRVRIDVIFCKIQSSISGLLRNNSVSALRTRSSVDDVIDDFKDHVWYFDCDDHKDSSIIDGCSYLTTSCTVDHTVHVVSPDYIANPDPAFTCTSGNCDGTHSFTGVPYCWTGQPQTYWLNGNSVSILSDYNTNRATEFDDQLDLGFFAGNVTSLNGGHGYMYRTAGLDCSGFAQLCYGVNVTGAKWGAGTFITDAESSSTGYFEEITSYEDSSKYDFLAYSNTSGHIVILDRYIWNATYTDIIGAFVYEATTKDDKDRVCYSYWTKSYIDTLSTIGKMKSTYLESCTHSWSQVENYECTIRRCDNCHILDFGDFSTYHDSSGPSATCTTDKICANNNCSYVITSALGHDYSGPSATCTSPQICARTGCNVVLEPATGHDWPSSWTTTSYPTCTSTGTEVKRCTICNALLDSQSIPATGHDWPSTWTTTSYPTCTSTGTEVKRCGDCNILLDSRSIAKLPHTWPTSWTVTQSPTCTVSVKSPAHTITEI